LADGKYWNEKIETMPTQEIQKLQIQKLKDQVKHCYENSVLVHWMIYKKYLLQLKVI
jgi:phenylacetate-coenzyme A ligase PaaK-like adenylate-forming protein